MKVLTSDWTQDRQNIVEDRYTTNNEDSWEEIYNRVSNSVNVNIKEEIKDFKFVPAGRILRGLGTDTDKTFFNCYFIKHRNIDGKGMDSRRAISDLEARAFEISARGGGIGINWSVLRPKESYIDGVDGWSTGPISFMKSLNATIETVQQGGSRRGAQMYGLEPWHPDIKEFITCKKNRDILNSANLSVFVSDKFMEAVKQDKEWDLIFPDTSWEKYDELWDGNIWKWKENGYPIDKYDTVKAKEIFNLIADGAHDNGEPGMIFLERANKLNIPSEDEYLQGSNPCFTGDMKLLTKNGFIKFNNLVNKNDNKVNINIITKDDNVSNGIVWYTGKKETIKIKLSNNKIIKCTPDHKFQTINNGMVEAKNLENYFLKPYNNEIVEVIDIIDNGIKDVYDFHEPKFNKGIVNGYIVSNCGEEILPPDGVCNLGAINLTQFVNFETKETLYSDLKNVVHKGVEFLDEIIDLNPYYQKETEEQQKEFRKIGLGFMGLADYFILKEIRYGSNESKKELKEVLSFIQNEAFRKSALLAKEKDQAHIWKEYMLNNKYIQQLDNDVIELIKKYGLRNTRITTIAPNGCLVKNTKIKTDKGNITIENIFERSNINIDNCSSNEWIIPQEEINVFDINNNKHRITKLYSNGLSETLKLEIEDGNTIEGTKDHKVLVKVSNNKAKWIELDEINEGDKILIKK